MIVAYGERKIEQGKEDAFERWWHDLQAAARDHPGFIAARLLRSQNHGGVHATIEFWESQEAFQAAYATDAVRSVSTRLFTERLTRQAPVTEYCTVIGAAGEVPVEWFEAKALDG